MSLVKALLMFHLYGVSYTASAPTDTGLPHFVWDGNLLHLRSGDYVDYCAYETQETMAVVYDTQTDTCVVVSEADAQKLPTDTPWRTSRD